MEVICINASFSAPQREFFALNGVTLPSQDALYSIRDVVLHTTIGRQGILVHEIINPKVQQAHNVLGTIHMEPTWSIERFRTLSGDIVDLAEIKKHINSPA